MNTIKNLQKLIAYASQDKLMQLEEGAKLHLRHSNIEFKIISVDDKLITVRTTQGKHMSENYASDAELITRTIELFEKALPGYMPIVHAVSYKPSEVDIVTPQWVANQMLTNHLKIKYIQVKTGIDKTNLSAWINGVRPMSQPVKAMFYYFFKDSDNIL